MLVVKRQGNVGDLRADTEHLATPTHWLAAAIPYCPAAGLIETPPPWKNGVDKFCNLTHRETTDAALRHASLSN